METSHIFGQKKKADPSKQGRERVERTRRAAPSKLPKPSSKLMTVTADIDAGYILLDDYEVMVDRESYQRPFDENRAKDMAEHYDAALAGEVYLSLRDAKDKQVWVVSGQHRIIAAAMADVPNIRTLLWKGLTLDQEAYLFNQEATQRVGISALDKFWSGVRAGFADHVAVAAVVERSGGYINRRLLGPDQQRSGGLNASNELLKVYDYVGEDLLEKSLITLREGFGELTGRTADAPFITGMAQFLGIYNADSPYGTADMAKLLKKMQASTPEAVKAKAKEYEVHNGMAPSRFMAIVDMYNRHTPERMKLDTTRPDWRKCNSKTCVNHAKRATYRRGLCRECYAAVREQEQPS